MMRSPAGVVLYSSVPSRPRWTHSLVDSSAACARGTDKAMNSASGYRNRVDMNIHTAVNRLRLRVVVVAGSPYPALNNREEQSQTQGRAVPAPLARKQRRVKGQLRRR